MTTKKNSKPAPKAAAAPKATPKPRADVLVTLGKQGRNADAIAAQPAQARIIVGVVAAAGSKGISRNTLVAKLPGAGLVTVQGPRAIWAFYGGKLQRAGILQVQPLAVAAPQASKAAKAA